MANVNLQEAFKDIIERLEKLEKGIAPVEAPEPTNDAQTSAVEATDETAGA